MIGLKRKGGFTLIELLVVLIILGILAAIAIPRYMIARNRAKATEAIQQMGVIIQDIQAIIDTTPGGIAPANLVGAGYTNDPWNPGGRATFNYAYSNATNIVTATETASGDFITFNVNSGAWGGNHAGVPGP